MLVSVIGKLGDVGASKLQVCCPICRLNQTFWTRIYRHINDAGFNRHLKVRLLEAARPTSVIFYGLLDYDGLLSGRWLVA